MGNGRLILLLPPKFLVSTFVEKFAGSSTITLETRT